MAGLEPAAPGVQSSGWAVVSSKNNGLREAGTDACTSACTSDSEIEHGSKVERAATLVADLSPDERRKLAALLLASDAGGGDGDAGEGTAR